MGNARITAAALTEPTRAAHPQRLVDLGAGDGDFLLQLTRHLPSLPAGLEVVLVDRHNTAEPSILEALRTDGFRPRMDQADALDWLRAASAQPGTWIVANLFLHHLSCAQLTEYLSLAGEKSNVFCACEPLRASWPLAVTRLLWIIGANSVTRHDAAISVRAGFGGEELSALWPHHAGWSVGEYRAGMFSHLFLAKRRHGMIHSASKPV